MASDDFHDYDDVPLPPDPPVLRPLHPDELAREELRARYLKPGFGFWMAVAWCILLLIVMNVVGLVLCGIPVLVITMAIDTAQGQAPGDAKAWMQSETGMLALMIILIGSHIVGLLFGWLMLRWQCGGRTWKRRIALSRSPTGTHVLLVLLGFPAMLALGTVIEQPIMKYIPSIQDFFNWANIQFEWPGIEAVEPLLKKSPLALAFFAVAILPAFNEEFWCRGFLGQGLSARYKGLVVAALTSFLFGCIHLEPRQGLWAMLLGMAIYGAYAFTRSLWVAIGIHMANNGLAVLHSNERLNFPVLQPLEDLLNRSPLLLLVGALSLFSAVAYALYQTRCKLAPVEPGMPTWEPKGVSSVELPPPNSGTIVTHEPISMMSVGLVLAGAVIFGTVLAFA